MKLVSWNVNGLRSAFSKGFTATLQHLAADLVCLQETKVLPEQLAPEQLTPLDYSLTINPATRRGYSGVGIYARGPWSSATALRTGLGEKRFDDEGRFLIADHGSFLLYNIYFPSGTSGDERQGFKYEFLDHLLDHLRQLDDATRRRLVICGDFNIAHTAFDIHHPREAERRGLSGFLPEERKWMDTFAELGFVDTFRLIHGNDSRRYSWWTYRANAREKNLGWRIDYIFVGSGLVEHVRNADIHEAILGSDHCPVSVELAL